MTAWYWRSIRGRPARRSSCSTTRRRSAGARTVRSRSTTRGPAGWSTTPTEIWRGVRRLVGAALADAGVRPGDVRAVGITNQRETTVLWDRATGEPVHRAIVWQDRRTAPTCERLKADGLEAEVRRRTGLVLDPYFSATKLRWLLDEVPGLARARRARRARVRNDRRVARLAAERRHRGRRCRAHDRRHERVAHAALQHRRAALGRDAPRRVRRPRARAPDRAPLRRRSRAHRPRRVPRRRTFRSQASPATSTRRCSGRRASARGWSRTRTAPARS